MWPPLGLDVSSSESAGGEKFFFNLFLHVRFSFEALTADLLSEMSDSYSVFSSAKKQWKKIINKL